MLLVVTSLKLLCEVALMALLGQWVLDRWVGSRGADSLFVLVFRTLTQPVIRVVRLLTPAVVLDRHLPLVAFLLLGWLWLWALWQKVQLCRADPAQGLCT